jgi:ABC-type multidrug transport system permease subunit
VGKKITYVDWLTPGILGMNMMFSCLFGVGYIVVRYRKSGFLKRLNATPLSASEFVAAQITSRLLLSVTITIGVYVAVASILDLRFEGNPGAVILVVVLGAAALVSMGFCVAARVSSEELASGLLNLISWPMMFLAGVWFSLEGSPAWVQYCAKLFPLTHTLDAARAIMLEGASLIEVWGQIAALGAMTLFWFFVGAYFFKWRE